MPARVHLADLGEALALESDRHGADRMTRAPAGGRGALEDEARHRRRCRSPGWCSPCRRRVVKPPASAARDAGRDRLLVLVARLAEVDVHVDQPGHDQQPARVEHARAVAASVPGRADAPRCGRPSISTSAGATVAPRPGRRPCRRRSAARSLTLVPLRRRARRLRQLALAAARSAASSRLAARDQQVEHAPCGRRRRSSPGP